MSVSQKKKKFFKRLHQYALFFSWLLLLPGKRFSPFSDFNTQFEVAGGSTVNSNYRNLGFRQVTDLEESPESVGAVPIAKPLLVEEAPLLQLSLTFKHIVSLWLQGAVFVDLILTFVILRLIDKIYLFLGKKGALVIARIKALIIAGVAAVQYMLFGIAHFLENML